MKFCCVPGCKSKAKNSSKKLAFYNLPNDRKNGAVYPLKLKRRLMWIRAIRGAKLSERTLKNLKICSKHFVTGQPAPEQSINHKDWVPNLNMPLILQPLNERNRQFVENLIDNLPEVIAEFDVPDYILLDKKNFNEKQIEVDLIEKYMTNPICDVDGYYNDDHDYLGLPILQTMTEIPRKDLSEEHNYCLTTRPACLCFDSRHFCNICAVNCDNLFSFNYHMMTHTLQNDVFCVVCLQRFLTSTCLNTHLTAHTGLCGFCGNQVPQAQLKAHQYFNRNQKNQNGDISRYKVTWKKKIHFCIYCLSKFVDRKDFTHHLISHKKRIKRVKENI